MEQIGTMRDLTGAERSRGQAGANLLDARGFMAGLVQRVWGWLRRSSAGPARLALIERVALSPKHALVLVEAEGQCVLVATSPEGAAAFFPLRSSATAIDRRPMEERLDTRGAAARHEEVVSHRVGGADCAGRVAW